MSQQALMDWLLLTRVSGIGAKRFQKLLSVFESPSEIFSLSAAQLRQKKLTEYLIQNILKVSPTEIQDDLVWLEAFDTHYIITYQDEDYPKLLHEIDTPPPVLYVSGNKTLLNDPNIAIVGSRNLTKSGQYAAYNFAKDLATSGLCIISGLALGVDGYAHRGALDAGGVTIAVMATGLDSVYPARHHHLAHQILEKKGALLSEFPIGKKIHAKHFPQRNRIISGLSRGTLVIEAAKRSGSLITARHAMEQGREVFAIPGSIHNPMARGCHYLIRQGAKLVEKSDHILRELVSLLDFDLNSSNIEANIEKTAVKLDDPEQQQIVDAMGYDPISIDQLKLKTGLTVQKVSTILMQLEIQGLIESYGGGRYIHSKTQSKAN